MDSFLLYLGASILGVSNMILWGIYGDLLVEEFKLKKVIRSIFFALLAGCFLYATDQELPLLVVALSSIALERLLTEFYKALWRVEDQNKYAIPSDLHLTLPVPLKRFFFIISIPSLAFILMIIPLPTSGLLLGLLAGLVTGFGGMLKDAPYEGFHLKKFFRSPIIAIVIGIILEHSFPLTHNMVVLLAIFGGERIVSEFYKKILMGRIPGKFKDTLPQNKFWEQKRKWLLPLYVVDIALLLSLTLL